MPVSLSKAWNVLILCGSFPPIQRDHHLHEKHWWLSRKGQFDLGDIPSGNWLRSGRCSICRWSMVNFLLLMVISMIFHYHMIAKWDMIINTTPRIPRIPETLWFLSEWTSFKEQKQIWLPRLPQKGVPPRDDVPSKIGVFQTWRNDNPFPIILNTLVGDFHIIGTI